MVFDYLKCYVDIINSFKTSIWTYCIISPPPQFGGGGIDHMVPFGLGDFRSWFLLGHVNLQPVVFQPLNMNITLNFLPHLYCCPIATFQLKN